MHRSLAVVGALACLLATTPASASFYATCTLKVTVLDVVSDDTGKPEAPSGVRARFKVDQVVEGGGHDKNFCRGFPEREAFDALLRTEDAAIAARVVPGATLTVAYRHANGMGANGYVESTTWGLVAPPAAETPTPALERCVADREEPVCWIGYGGPDVLAASTDGARALRWGPDQIDSCGNGPLDSGTISLVTATVKGGALKAAGTDALAFDREADLDAIRADLWTRAAGIAGAKGLAPLGDLVVSRTSAPAGIQAHYPAATLGGPLDGLRVTVELKDASYVLTLEGGPAPRTLGTLPAPRFRQYNMDRTRDDEPEWISVTAAFPSVEQVSLLGQGATRRILVGISAHDGGHCSAAKRLHLVADLPAGPTGG